MPSKSQINLIRSLALQKRLDPAAVLAVANQEGLSGGVGDRGTSFGPFQMHVGGAFPSSIRGNRQAWAWSQAGLDYALSQISKVASGLRGKAAVENIVRRFERPANPDREVAGALRDYGAGGRSALSSLPATSASPPALGQSSGNPLLEAILSGATDLTDVIRSEFAGGTGSPLGGSVFAPKPLPYRRETPMPYSNLPGILGQTLPAELLREGTGGPTHSTGPHIHAAYTNPKAILAAIQLAQSLGLHVGENPYVGEVAPVHAKNSYHYRTFPGLYHGHKLGEAIDVSGPNMLKFYRMLSRN